MNLQYLANYILKYNLWEAGPLGEGELFAGDVEEGISMVFGGIPRIINRICEKTLLYTYQQKKRLVEEHIIRYATDHEMMQADMIKM